MAAREAVAGVKGTCHNDSKSSASPCAMEDSHGSVDSMEVDVAPRLGGGIKADESNGRRVGGRPDIVIDAEGGSSVQPDADLSHHSPTGSMSTDTASEVASLIGDSPGLGSSTQQCSSPGDVIPVGTDLYKIIDSSNLDLDTKLNLDTGTKITDLDLLPLSSLRAELKAEERAVAAELKIKGGDVSNEADKCIATVKEGAAAGGAIFSPKVSLAIGSISPYENVFFY